MFLFFERLINPVALPPGDHPPTGLLAFYWYFLGQAKWLFSLMLAVGAVVAMLDASIPYFIGRLLDILSKTPRDGLFAAAGPSLAMMALVVLVLRPATIFLHRIIANHGIATTFKTLIRWQSYFHVIRQSLDFFQNDFAGRVATHVMQAGQAVRETILAIMRSILHMLFYGVSAIVLLVAQDWRLALPMIVWFVLYVLLLGLSVPRMRRLSKTESARQSAVTGKVVDNFSNILTVKLFARTDDEDSHVRDGMLALTAASTVRQRVNTLFTVLLNVLNAGLLTATAAIGVALWQASEIEIAALAMVLALVSQLISMSGFVAAEIQGIFENVGVVQESMLSIARPLSMQDRPGAVPIALGSGRIEFRNVGFGYGRADRPVIEDLSLRIEPGEKVGLVGRSGAGKSTLVSLLMRFHDVVDGDIRIDGQDVRTVTQDSLRRTISVVTQDTSLMHRSIRDNILYGRPDATTPMLQAAADKAEASSFIANLKDSQGRSGYDAHVGERGVKLSGGQRQRIAIARVLLKDAPILILDEATAALDSEVEAAIQDNLGALMQGKTVIAIAHRLSTLQIMDRIVVLDQGRIIEEGTHAALIAKRGLYAELWARQSGGFLDEGQAAAE